MTTLIVLQSLNLLVCLFLAVTTRKAGGLSKRARRREEYARQSVLYAEQLGGDKLQHALNCFRALDVADNKRRDYSDSEARIAIEAAVASLNKVR